MAPNSSATSTSWPRERERVHQAQDADGLVHDDGIAQSVAAHPALGEQIGDQVLARPMPSTSSSEPRHTGKKLCGASIS